MSSDLFGSAVASQHSADRTGPLKEPQQKQEHKRQDAFSDQIKEGYIPARVSMHVQVGHLSVFWLRHVDAPEVGRTF